MTILDTVAISFFAGYWCGALLAIVLTLWITGPPKLIVHGDT